MDAEDNPTTYIVDEEPVSVRNDSPVSSSSPFDSEIITTSKVQETSLVSYGNGPAYTPPIYATIGQPFYYRGYNNNAEWDEHANVFLNPEGLDLGSQGIYPENSPVMVHAGLAYAPQLQFTSYPDLHLYPPQQISYSGAHYYRPIIRPTLPYRTPPTPISQIDVAPPVASDSFGTRPDYSGAPGSFPRGNTPNNFGNVSANNTQLAYNRYVPYYPQSFTRPADRQGSFSQLNLAGSQPFGTYGSFSNFGTASTQQQQHYAFEASANNFDRNRHHHSSNHDYGRGSSSVSCAGSNCQGWQGFENNRRYGRGRGSLYYNNGSSDGYPDQSRGPRSLRPKNQNTVVADKTFGGKYNNPDFVTDYDEARFFIIKSYSENDIHQCIKYRIWASTTNGNRKLDAVYNDAKKRRDNYPVFLFFSVNASAQFCGVAEMIGPVDFDRSVDFWLQDKWSGQFPVKWHIVKDVPNTQFRHIILQNNENRPVTSSRDTHEIVNVEQGVEMLKIFKSYEYRMSILEDYEHYEEKHRLLEEKRVRGEGEGSSSAHNNTLPAKVIDQMAARFSGAVILNGADGATTVLTGTRQEGLGRGG